MPSVPTCLELKVELPSDDSLAKTNPDKIFELLVDDPTC